MPRRAAGRKLLESPASIWRAFRKRGGLDLEYHDDMGEDVVRSLLRELNAAGSPSVAAALRKQPELTVEEFLRALLEALNPFSTMLSDLLGMFERAGAGRTDSSMKIRFAFEKAPPLSFDLRQFRDWVETVQRVRELVRVRSWTFDELMELDALLRTRDLRDAAELLPSEPWYFEYAERRIWPDFELPLPVSGEAGVDDVLRKCFDVWSAIVRESSKYDRWELQRAPGEGRVRVLAQLDAENWSGVMAMEMHGLAHVARTRPRLRAVLEQRVQAIEALFARVTTSTIEQESSRRIVSDFLNLPVWQRRHELYSAWIATLIAGALDGRDLRFHHDDGLLSFSFGGSHLATAEGVHPHLHVWAELRSPLDGESALSGRRNIQPDYTLVADPITSKRSAVAVVECKQYRSFSKRNFSHAVIDYADGLPNASIVLAAYGPVRDDFLSEIRSRKTRNRIALVGHLRPGNAEARERFRSVLRQAIAARYPEADEPPLPADPFTITMKLLRAPRTLDVRVHVRRDEGWSLVELRSQGNTSSFRCVPLEDATYRCTVHAPPGVALAGSGVEMAIMSSETEVRLPVPRSGSGRYWHVFDYSTPFGHIRFASQVVDRDPAEAQPDNGSKPAIPA